MFVRLELESGYLTTLYSCDDCQRRVPISCVRRQASDPWLTLTTVGVCFYLFIYFYIFYRSICSACVRFFNCNRRVTNVSMMTMMMIIGHL